MPNIPNINNLNIHKYDGTGYTETLLELITGITIESSTELATSSAIQNYVNTNSFNSTDTQIIFNSGETLTGSTNFTYDGNIFNMIEVNTELHNGKFNMYSPIYLESGDVGGFDHYWVGGGVTTGDIVRSISHIGYSLGITGTFIVGDNVTGTTSLATGKIVSVDGYQAIVLLVDNVSGIFLTGETITGDNGATGTVDEFNSNTPAVFEMISSINFYRGGGFIKNVVGTPTPGDVMIKDGYTNFFQCKKYEPNGRDFISTSFENKQIIFGDSRPSVLNNKTWTFTNLAGDDLPTLAILSEGQNAALIIGTVGGSDYGKIQKAGSNINIGANITDAVIRYQRNSAESLFIGVDYVKFNYNNSNVDFKIEKNISGQAFIYDAGLDTLTFNSNGMSITNGTNVNEFYSTYNEFNKDNVDVDFIINKNISGQAFIYDAGLGTLNINSPTHLNSAQFVNITAVNTATYNLATYDYILHVTYTSIGATTLTLLTTQTIVNRQIVIKDAGGNALTNNITINTEGSETIDGNVAYTININYDSINLYCDGSNWFVN